MLINADEDGEAGVAESKAAKGKGEKKRSLIDNSSALIMRY
jgi:hypothetical protein